MYAMSLYLRTQLLGAGKKTLRSILLRTVSDERSSLTKKLKKKKLNDTEYTPTDWAKFSPKFTTENFRTLLDQIADDNGLSTNTKGRTPRVPEYISNNTKWQDAIKKSRDVVIDYHDVLESLKAAEQRYSADTSEQSMFLYAIRENTPNPTDLFKQAFKLEYIRLHILSAKANESGADSAVNPLQPADAPQRWLYSDFLTLAQYLQDTYDTLSHQTGG